MLRRDDLPEVVALRRRVFRFGERRDVAALTAYADRVFFGHPHADGSPPSLVYENRDGRAIGFLGVIPGRMLFQDERICVAVASQMMVAPESRGLAGVQLLRAFLAGPQDLSLSDAANGPVRRLWERLGAVTAVTDSLTFERALRPCRYFSSQMGSRWPLRAARFALRPFLQIADRVAFGRKPPPGYVEPLDAATLVSHADRVLGHWALRPSFDVPSLNWLFERVSEKRQFGSLSARTVRRGNGDVAGWFMHQVRRGGTSQVLQAAAAPALERLVLDHLLYDAWRAGAVAIAGRLQREFTHLLAVWQVGRRDDGPWMVLHSRRPEIVHAIERGDAFVSRLDGEWYLSF